MATIIKKISKFFEIFSKNTTKCDGCAYYKASGSCNLFAITEDWVEVKAKDGCENYLHKNELIRK